VNSAFPPTSARRAAWLLARRTGEVYPTPLSGPPPGEVERLELVSGIAEHMQNLADPKELAVCVRLLEHLRAPVWRQLVTLRVQ